VDDALKTRGNIYLNVETSLLFAPPYQNFWLRACCGAKEKVGGQHKCLSFMVTFRCNEDWLAMVNPIKPNIGL